MGKTCNNCAEKVEKTCKTEENINVTVPYVVHESAMARSERHNKRLWIVILVLIGALIASNAAWIIYNSQFEVVEESVTVEQDNQNGDNNYIGNDGDITYGETEDND